MKIEIDKYVRTLTKPFSVLVTKAQNQLRKITPDTFTEGLAMSVKSNIENITMEMSYIAVKWTKKEVPKVYNRGKIENTDLLKIAGYSFTVRVNHKGYITKMQEESLFYLNRSISGLRDFTDQYINAVRNSLKALSDLPVEVAELDFRKMVDSVIADTVKKKMGVNFAKKNILTSLLNVVDDASFVFVNGRNYDINYYTDMVARTELAKTYNQAHLATFKEFGDDLVKMSTHAGSCPICSPFQGIIYSLSGENKDYEAYPPDAHLPIHPNCGHTLLPVTLPAGDQYE